MKSNTRRLFAMVLRQSLLNVMVINDIQRIAISKFHCRITNVRQLKKAEISFEIKSSM